MNKTLDCACRVCYVQIMNSDKKEHELDGYRSLLVLDEISRNHDLTQRDMSRNLGIALGLINSYIKNLAGKGYITISSIPKKRYTYYLTPQGFSEKTRLTYEHLRNFTNLYRVARKDFRHLFSDMEKSGIRKIAFCGVDEIAEIAYMSLREVNIELAGVADDAKKDGDFFGYRVLPVSAVPSLGIELVIITSFQRGEELRAALVGQGVKEEKICDISRGGWLKKLEA